MRRAALSKLRSITVLATALVVALAAFGLAACQKRSSADEVVVSISNLSAPYMVMMGRYFEQAAQSEGLTVVIVDGRGDSAKQTADLRAADARGARAVIVAPNDSRALAAAVDTLQSAGVTVIAVDRRLEGTQKPVPYVGADNVEGGRLLGQWVVQNFPQGAKAVLITNDPGSSSQIDRSEGVHSGLTAGGAAFQIVAEQTGNSSRDQALTVTQNILTALGPNLPQVIICLNDDMAMGALEAIRAAGIAKGAIKVLGFDATPEALSRIKTGEMSATIEQSPAKQVRAALDQAVAALRGRGAVQSASLRPTLITATNLAEAERFAEVK
jgi:inositol transport system substrate-binding protein